jgi:outer membrane protein assembly factor BamD
LKKPLNTWQRLGPALLVIVLVVLFAPGCKKRVNKSADRKARTKSAQQMYDEGKALLDRGRYFRARTHLDRALSKPGVTRDLVADVNLALADAYFYDGGIINVAESLSRYTSFLTFYPAHPRADYAQYQLGLSYLKQALGPDKDQDTTHKALEQLRKVVREHPDSEWAGKAREQMAVCRERLAESELLVGVFYQKRKAYNGAAERFKELLDKYPGYSHRDRVFFELAESLKAMRKTAEALTYFQKIVDEFPDSRYHGRARSAVEDASSSSADRKAEAKQEPDIEDGKSGEEGEASGGN